MLQLPLKCEFPIRFPWKAIKRRSAFSRVNDHAQLLQQLMQHPQKRIRNVQILNISSFYSSFSHFSPSPKVLCATLTNFAKTLLLFLQIWKQKTHQNISKNLQTLKATRKSPRIYINIYIDKHIYKEVYKLDATHKQASYKDFACYSLTQTHLQTHTYTKRKTIIKYIIEKNKKITKKKN